MASVGLVLFTVGVGFPQALAEFGCSVGLGASWLVLAQKPVCIAGDAC